MTVRIATWNVNSIRARMPNILGWLAEASPDVALLQETKTVDDAFPRLEVEAAGYRAALYGQKGYNGVAILSRLAIDRVIRGFPGDGDDTQARYIEAVLGGGRLRVASLYVPNGNPVGSEKFSYKLAWLARLHRHGARLLRDELPTVLGGDYNVCPTDADVYAPDLWADDALCRPESRQQFRALCHLGYTDAIRALDPRPGQYTFWDYQAGAWAANHGLRIDHLLLSPQAADRLRTAGIDRRPRARDKASDHTPVWCELDV